MDDREPQPNETNTRTEELIGQTVKTAPGKLPERGAELTSPDPKTLVISTIFHRLLAGLRYLVGPPSLSLWFELGVVLLLAIVVAAVGIRDSVLIVLAASVMLIIFSPYVLFRRISQWQRVVHFALALLSFSSFLLAHEDPNLSSQLFDLIVILWFISSVLLIVSDIVAISRHVIPMLRSRIRESHGTEPVDTVRSIVESIANQFDSFNESIVLERERLVDTFSQVQAVLASRSDELKKLDGEVAKLKIKASKYDEIARSGKKVSDAYASIHFRRSVIITVIIGLFFLVLQIVVTPFSSSIMALFKNGSS